MRISDWSSDVCSSDLFIHAGNLAYLSLVTLFPFFIVATAAATIFGRTEDGMAGVSAFLSNVPPGVANALRGPIEGVLTARTGHLLWFGAGVGLCDRKSVVSGKSVSVRVDLGGRRCIIKKKKKK